MNVIQLAKCTGAASATAKRWLPSIHAAMDRFEINTPMRQIMFLANIGVESDYLMSLSENLNYSAEGLLETFGVHFPGGLAEAQEFAYSPQKIANRVYANRYGNGDENSGDGWNYRGSGLMQITFKANFEKTGKEIGIDLVAHPDLLRQYGDAPALSAASFFRDHGCNELADAGDFLGVARKITGCQFGVPNGWQARQELFNAGKEIMGVK